MPQTVVHPITLKKAQKDTNTMIVGDFNTHYHQRTCHPDKKKKTREKSELINTIDKMKSDICRLFHPAIA
jgi:uncharacterized short protein YbdD (DUF466 family)